MRKIRAAALILAFALGFSALAAGCGSSRDDESSVTQDIAQVDRSGKNLVRPGIMTADQPEPAGTAEPGEQASESETPDPTLDGAGRASNCP